LAEQQIGNWVMQVDSIGVFTPTTPTWLNSWVVSEEREVHIILTMCDVGGTGPLFWRSAIPKVHYADTRHSEKKFALRLGLGLRLWLGLGSGLGLGQP